MWIIYAFGTAEVKMSCYKIRPAKTLGNMCLIPPDFLIKEAPRQQEQIQLTIFPISHVFWPCTIHCPIPGTILFCNSCKHDSCGFLQHGDANGTHSVMQHHCTSISECLQWSGKYVPQISYIWWWHVAVISICFVMNWLYINIPKLNFMPWTALLTHAVSKLILCRHWIRHLFLFFIIPGLMRLSCLFGFFIQCIPFRITVIKMKSHERHCVLNH